MTPTACMIRIYIVSTLAVEWIEIQRVKQLLNDRGIVSTLAVEWIEITMGVPGLAGVINVSTLAVEWIEIVRP